MVVAPNTELTRLPSLSYVSVEVETVGATEVTGVIAKKLASQRVEVGVTDILNHKRTEINETVPRLLHYPCHAASMLNTLC